MSNYTIRKFDLNIERILEDWEVYHGIREVIANALDEPLITNTKDIEIFKGDPLYQNPRGCILAS